MEERGGRERCDIYTLTHKYIYGKREREREREERERESSLVTLLSLGSVICKISSVVCHDCRSTSPLIRSMFVFTET